MKMTHKKVYGREFKRLLPVNYSLMQQPR